MAAFGSDFRAARQANLYRGSAVWGPALTVLVALGMVVALTLFQALFGLLSAVLIYGMQAEVGTDFVKAMMVGLLPAGLAGGGLAWWLAGRSTEERRERLGLVLPDLGVVGWLLVCLGFIIGMYLVIIIIMVVFQIDPAQYTPGPHGESPSSGSAGVVKELMFNIANDPRMFAMVLPAVVIGAPVAEEMIFRGQLFAALRQTRLGNAGAAVLTSAAWALMHMSEPWFSIGLIFVMGLVLSWLLLRYGSLALTIILHGLWNAIYALIIFVGMTQIP